MLSDDEIRKIKARLVAPSHIQGDEGYIKRLAATIPVCEEDTAIAQAQERATREKIAEWLERKAEGFRSFPLLTNHIQSDLCEDLAAELRKEATND